MRRTVLLLLSCAVLVIAIASSAQTFNTMYDFQGLNDSGYPWASLVQGVDGSYYGEAQGISQNDDLGAIFKITSSSSFTTVQHFEVGNPQGPAGPIGGMVRAADGNLYGVSEGGGLYIAGTVFRVATDDTVTTVYSFCSLGANCPDGSSPWAPPIQGADGTLYGTTASGGTTDLPVRLRHGLSDHSRRVANHTLLISSDRRRQSSCPFVVGERRQFLWDNVPRWKHAGPLRQLQCSRLWNGFQNHTQRSAHHPARFLSAE